MRRRLWTWIALPAILLGGCGGSPFIASNLVQIRPPGGFEPLAFPGEGISVHVPSDWRRETGRPPLLAVVWSGPAVIDLWSYRVSGAAIPYSDTAALANARTALLASARRRQPGLRLVRSALARVGPDGAVILDTVQRLEGHLRQLRSLHIYAQGREFVLEAYAPRAVFHAIDRLVFSPVRHSLVLSGRS